MIFPAPSILRQAYIFLGHSNKYPKKQTKVNAFCMPLLSALPLQCNLKVSWQGIPGISYLKTLLHQQPFYFILYFIFAQPLRGLLKTDSNFSLCLKKTIKASLALKGGSFGTSAQR